MAQELVSYIGGVILLSGAAFSLLAAIGVLRLPDLLTRLHAASKAGVVGGGLVLLAVGIVSSNWNIIFGLDYAGLCASSCEV
jgi:multicomponent Na+:H+ antiporter subunit G